MKLQGIICAVITPFRKDATVNDDAIRQHIDYLISNGVSGLFLLGTTGEFGLISAEERTHIIKTVVDQNNHRVPVLIGVSDPGTMNMIVRAKEAESLGADAVFATTPFYHKTSQEGILRHYESLAKSVDLPVVVYNYPAVTGLTIQDETLLQLKEIENIVAMKFTTTDMADFLTAKTLVGDKIALLIGADSLIYTALSMGAIGSVSGAANAIPSEMVSIYNHFIKGDLKSARAIQERVLPLLQAIGLGTYPAGVKEAMRQLGREAGPVRSPLVELSENERQKISHAIKASGIKPWKMATISSS